MVRILVTGGCGFIGSNFINYILDRFKDVLIYNIDKLDYCSNVNNVYHKNSYKLYIGDINDKELVLDILRTNDINIVVHFAAQTHVDNSFGNSLQFTYDNILGTHTLLECCREWGKLSKFVHISTDEVYGEVDIDHIGCCEKSLLNPTNPYAATKAGAEFLVKSYYHSFNLPIIITRANNVYGPNQYPEKLIPKFIKLLNENKKMTIQGKGDTRRNFIHVYDVASAIAIIFMNGEINNIYNIGTTNEYSVIDIAKQIYKIVKNDDKNFEDWIEYIPDRNFNDFRYAISCDSLKKLGWYEEIPFEEGIYDTIEFYSSTYQKSVLQQEPQL